MNTILGALLVLLAVHQGAQSATITTIPTNSSGILGQNATVYCGVTGNQNVGENLSWRRVSPVATFIGNDASPSNTTKYQVTDKYRLMIKDLILGDEGSYQCTLFPDSHTVWVVVSDPPSSATLLWPESRTYTQKDQQANLTCTSTTSRPPATFRWFRGSTEVTSSAIHPTATTDTNGYGTSQSVMQLTPTSADEGVVYVCKVDVPGGEAYITKELAVSFSGAGHVVFSFAVLLMSMTAGLSV